MIIFYRVKYFKQRKFKKKKAEKDENFSALFISISFLTKESQIFAVFKNINLGVCKKTKTLRLWIILLFIYNDLIFIRKSKL